MNETIYAMMLTSMEGMTPLRCYALFRSFGSFIKIFNTPSNGLNEVLNSFCNRGTRITSDLIKKQGLKYNKFQKYYNRLISINIQVFTVLDEEFPIRLLDIEDCPIVIYMKGNAKLPEFGIGIVGARRCSDYGRKVAHYMARELAKEGVNIISGLAYGVDVSSHLGALEANGFTTSVLGGGLHECYPPKHLSIFNQISEAGCLISEEPYGKMTEPYMFPKRNRIISGLSHGILVVEAARKSGSLITVDFALEQGREVFTVPGRLFDPLAEGTNNLIKLGAKQIFTCDDILDEFVNIFKKNGNKSNEFEKKLEEKEKIVYSCISYDPIHEEILVNDVFDKVNICVGTFTKDSEFNKDELKILAAMDESDIHLSLLGLELKGLIIKKSGCYYARSEV